MNPAPREPRAREPRAREPRARESRAREPRSRWWLQRTWARLCGVRRSPTSSGLRITVSLTAAALAGAVCGFLVYAYRLPFPSALQRAPLHSVQVLDRHAHRLAEVRADGQLHTPVTYGELPPLLVHALLAAEDQRFFAHPGVDPLAIARASWSALTQRRWVSGASTLTQQLARRTFDRPRTLRGKLREAALALRIERSWSKPRILAAYLNRVDFGPQLVGVAAAARAYFAKPVEQLSLSEAASLVALVRGPSYYHPQRHPQRLQRRRDHILERLQQLGLSSASEVARAKATPLKLTAPVIWPGAHHWVRRTAKGTESTVHTTLDGPLQQRVERLVRLHVQQQQTHGKALDAAVLVVDNPTAEVRAYVGSPDYFSRAGGQNDGVTALRQPGSTLKPFVYAAAMQQLGYTAATILPDIQLELREAAGVYVPRNYDGRFRGPVRLREALANSLNVPAVHTAARLGPASLLRALRQFGFSSLERDPAHYGAALALGNGEVSLQELAAAYRALARAGRYTPLRTLRTQPSSPETTATSPKIAAILLDILSDDQARSAAFGRHGPLEFPFPVAVKTGTSKGARDNWTVGVTAELTVAVWVGHFDGTPQPGSSGVSGAAPLFHAVMLEAMEPHPAPRPLIRAAGLRNVEICPLSGLLASNDCPSRITESFIAGTEPARLDDWHQRHVVLDGMLARSDCAGAQPRVLERYPQAFVAWARVAQRPLTPDGVHPRCPPQGSRDVASTGPQTGHPTLSFPRDGALFELDDSIPRSQRQLVLQANSSSQEPLWFLLNGQRLGPTPPPHRLTWPLSLGRHELRVVDAAGRTSPAVHFEVRPRRGR